MASWLHRRLRPPSHPQHQRKKRSSAGWTTKKKKNKKKRHTGRRFQQDNEYREFLRRVGTGVRRFRVMHVDGWIIDATDDVGCIARHVQCAMSSDAADANCMIAVDPKGRGVGIFATRIIEPGEELVSNYLLQGMFEPFRGAWVSWGLDELEDMESDRVADRAPVFLRRNVRSVQRTLPDGHMMPQMVTSHQLPWSLTLTLRECQSSVAIAGRNRGAVSTRN